MPHQETFRLPTYSKQNTEDDHFVDDQEEQDDHTRWGKALKYGT